MAGGSNERESAGGNQGETLTSITSDAAVCLPGPDQWLSVVGINGAAEDQGADDRRLPDLWSGDRDAGASARSVWLTASPDRRIEESRGRCAQGAKARAHNASGACGGWQLRAVVVARAVMAAPQRWRLTMQRAWPTTTGGRIQQGLRQGTILAAILDCE